MKKRAIDVYLGALRAAYWIGCKSYDLGRRAWRRAREAVE